ncbi:MAG: HEWD family protein [Halorhabdus sp.]
MTRIDPPTDRTCERCGRQEVWDGTQGVWRTVESDGTRQAGRPHCLHEWDINGTYNPVAET